jgi:alanine-glyoxylate transaminase/serine-glyoxylate transaminase/serine-pyruvate transaminase
MRAAAQARCPSWYFDFRRQRQSLARACMLTTPPISVMYALEEGVAMLREEGLQPSWARHARTAQTLRAGLRAAGLDLIARADRASNTVTAVRSPVRSRAVLEALLHDLRVTRGVVVAHGLGQLEGRSFRIGHLGRISARELGDLLGAVTDVMCIRELAA